MSLEEILELDKKLVMKYKQVFILLNMRFKIPFKIIYAVWKEGENIFGWMGMDWKIAHYESYGKIYHKINTT